MLLRFICGSSAGTPYRDIIRSFNTALRRAEIEDFTFHDLRHTFASNLVMKGVNLRVVQELLGHKDIKMTMRYAYLAEKSIVDAVVLLDENNPKIRTEDDFEQKKDSANLPSP